MLFVMLRLSDWCLYIWGSDIGEGWSMMVMCYDRDGRGDRMST